FEVVGVFEVGMYEFDRGLGVIHLDDAQALLRMSDQVSGVRLMLEDLFQAPRVVRDVAEGLGGRYRISDWTREHANFFRAIRTEKTVMFIILSLIVGVAAFNIVSTLVMVVQDKQPDIAILRTIGATPRMIMLIFLVQGLLIGVIGTLLGLSAGLALALNIDVVVPFIEALTGQQFLAPDVYYISDLPSEVERGDLIRVGGMAFLLALFSGLYPAWRAARTLPAEALRHE
ncbi:MAG: FtsX-like permease family protein, partial [Algiphilus sp.]